MNGRFKMKNKISLFSVVALSLTMNPLWANELDRCKALFNKAYLNNKAKYITYLKGDTFFNSLEPKSTEPSKKEQERIEQYEQARDDFYRSLEGPAASKEKINIKAEQITVLQPDRTFIPLPVYPTKYGKLTKRGLLHAKGLDPWEWPTD